MISMRYFKGRPAATWHACTPEVVLIYLRTDVAGRSGRSGRELAASSRPPVCFKSEHVLCRAAVCQKLGASLSALAILLSVTTQEVSHEYLELDILEDSAQSSRT